MIYEYKLRTETGRWLADIILRSDGFFAAVSDWGNYAYRWTHAGMEFRAFVAGLDRPHDDYLCSKLAKRDFYDGEATLKRIKERIAGLRRGGSWTAERAAKEWAVLKDACSTFFSADSMTGVREIDLLQFHRFYENTSLDDAGELACYDYPNDVRGFCREVMPALAKAIREELAQGEATSAEVGR